LNRRLHSVLIPAALLLAASVTTSGQRADATREVRSRLGSAEQAFQAGSYQLARGLFEEAATGARELSNTNILLARAIDRLADLDRLEGSLERAEAGYLRSAAIWPVLLGEDQPRLATTLHNLGAVYLEQGRLDDAERVLGEALAIWDRTLGVDSAEAANTRTALDNIGVRRILSMDPRGID
jgi:tetratricopeptide (TPR) repeat protein